MIRTAEDRAARHLSNFEAWCRHFDAPAYELLDHRHHPAREDRCLIRAGVAWLYWLAAQSRDHLGAVHRWTAAIRNHHPFPTDELTAVDGWRGNRTFAAIQFIEHKWHDVHALEVDFDLGNPQDAAGLLLHAGEWAYYRLPILLGRRQIRTDPFLVARWLRRSRIDG